MDKQSSYQMSRDISIAVSNLKTWCIIGVYPFERIVPQQLCVSAVCTMQLATSELQDDISGTLDYTIIARCIRRTLKKERFHLLESAAKLLCTRFLDLSPCVRRVEVRIVKKKIYSVSMNGYRQDDAP